MNTNLFKDIEEETPEKELNVQGKLPSWLEGSLFRNGPAKYKIGEQSVNHWFDGFSMLHKFSIANGKVKYTSRFLQSDDYIRNQRTGRIKSRHFGTVQDPCESIFHKFFSIFQLPKVSNCNVSVLKLNERIAAVSDFSTMVEFDRETLDTKGQVEFPDEFGTKYMFSASHFSYDPDTKEYYNCLGVPGPKGDFHFFKISSEDTFERKVIGKVKAPKHTYFHSVGLTKKYFIFIEQPFELNLWQLLMSRLLNKPYESCYEWKPEKGCKFHLLNRETGEIRTMQSEAFFFFHTVNCYDEGNKIIIDLCLYKDPSIIKSLYLEHVISKGVPKEQLGTLVRITLNPDSNKVTFKEISEEYLDLATFDFSRSCKPYRYVYGLGFNKHTENLDVNNQILKIDTETGEVISRFEKGKYPSEPLFIPSPDAKSEDDGVIVTVVLDAEKCSSYLLVLDAKNLSELARAETSAMVQPGLHGMFYNDCK
ncbi:MAG: carotenoid oxygenase family protein [Cytophagaceae bacterium]